MAARQFISPTQWGPTQNELRVRHRECLQFFPSPHEAAVWPSATVGKNMVASVVKAPTMIMVTLLCGRALSGRALWRLLIQKYITSNMTFDFGFGTK